MASNEFELGMVNGLPEVRVMMEYRDSVPVPIIKTRSTTIKAFVSINQRDNVSEEVLSAVGECAMWAGAGAAIAGIIPGGLAALPVFVEAFGACAAAKGLNLVAEQVQLRTETTYGDWI